ncbi:hypothetical protein GCM10017687_61790 [Streptomyces echinatus]|uniref:Uncharacterized protein n=1 Tax=Streptomyces echinatus TaxID=67293 RepID=A0A7W9PTJ5_9ACTN|nr:hypothetical protein [Streptomyces echinatus]
MSTRSSEARQALSRFGDLTWFKLPKEYNDILGRHQVTYLGWRYQVPREDVAQTIENAVRESPTQLEWALDRTRRNWILLPSCILHEARGLANPAFANVIHSIGTLDQEFCLKTVSDLKLIIRHLQQIPAPAE